MVSTNRPKFINHDRSKLQEIATQWDPAKGTFPSFMANRGMQRANKFVSDLNVPDSKFKFENTFLFA